jgi:cell division septum initiation protein DivIVA
MVSMVYKPEPFADVGVWHLSLLKNEASFVAEFLDILVQQLGYIQQHLLSVQEEVHELSRKVEKLEDALEKVTSMLTETRQNAETQTGD